jgi:hypothetical protein
MSCNSVTRNAESSAHPLASDLLVKSESNENGSVRLKSVFDELVDSRKDTHQLEEKYRTFS